MIDIMVFVCYDDVMKMRTQVQLDPEDHEALKQWAHQRGISLSAAVRWLIRMNLQARDKLPEKTVNEIVALSGAISGKSDEGDVSVRHDEYLYGDGNDT
ncbi:MAG: CopG family transcriptional regulator [Pseudomonadota bacterium]